MGKGFNNYMCKKFFHPASRDNLKRVWMAEQQTEAYKKKQEELRVQYEKEQDLYTNKAIMSKESKEKLSVNFLYEPPPGTKKDREREDDEPEFRFEWQRKYNAPRESYCKGDQEIRDQPFGIQVRNVRCIKCHKWGHINTDKECPMYNQSATGAETGSNLNPSELIRQMREDGLAMKKGAVGLLELPNGPSQSGGHQLIASSSEDEDHMNETEFKFLEGLSTKKKLKMLRKIEKIEKKKTKKSKQREKKKDGSKNRKNTDSGNESNSSSEMEKKITRNGEEWTKKGAAGGNSKNSLRAHERDMPNDLYTVLGRKMDFEGPPQFHSKRQPDNVSKNGSSKKRASHSRSPSRDRSRSRSPKKRINSSSLKHEYSAQGNRKRDERHSYSSEHKINKNRSDSPSTTARHHYGRGRDRSPLKQKISKSRSRSRDRSTHSRYQSRKASYKH